MVGNGSSGKEQKGADTKGVQKKGAGQKVYQLKADGTSFAVASRRASLIPAL
jgi:hypothetical protein